MYKMKTNHHQKWVLISLIILFLLFGGIYLSSLVDMKMGAKNNKSSNQEEKSYAEFYKWPEEYPQKLLDTTGWKTYINTKYGYKVKFPADFKLEATTPSQNIKTAPVLSARSLGTNEDPDQYVSFGFMVHEREVYASDEKGSLLFSDNEIDRLNILILRNNNSEEKRFSRPRIIGDNLAGGYEYYGKTYSVIGTATKPEELNVDFRREFHILKHNDLSVEIDYGEGNYRTPEEKKQANAIIDTILSTFEFTK